MSDIIIDAKDMILGRFATFVAKQALLGHTVKVINCGEAVLTGKKEDVVKKWKHRMDMGQPQQGPYVQRMPDRFVRKSIRGMLPIRQDRGRVAFKRIMCYIGVPKELEGKETTKLEKADVSKLPNLKYITVNTLCNEIGGYNA